MSSYAIVAVFLSLLISLWGGSTTAGLAATVPVPLAATSSLLPSYPSGDLKLYHFPGNVQGNVGFTPDGSAYSLVRSGILRIAPDGTKTFVNVAAYGPRIKVGGRIVYSNGFLWYEVFEGLIRMRPDGTDSRYLQVPSDFGPQRELTNLTAGADGIYYTYYNGTANGLEPVLASVTNAFVKTLYPLVAPAPRYPSGSTVGSIVYGPDGNVYFQYNNPPHKGSFGRVTPSGVVTLFPYPDTCGDVKKFVYARGSFYFRVFTAASGSTPATYSLCRVAPSTGEYSVVLSSTYISPTYSGFDIVADDDGNLWTAGFFGTGLYSYAIPTGVVSGPIDPNVVNVRTAYGFPNLYIGPDQNIYFFGVYASNQIYFGAYVRHRMSFTPSVVGLLPSDAAMNFYVSEPIAGGPWSAISLNPAIATVTPVSSSVGRFSVTEVGHGSTSIKVTDVYGNIQYVPVTAN